MKTVLEFEGERYELKPLNREKTHPLTQHAIGVLRDIAVKPIPRQSLNPGVANRLARARKSDHAGSAAKSLQIPPRPSRQRHLRSPADHRSRPDGTYRA